MRMGFVMRQPYFFEAHSVNSKMENGWNSMQRMDSAAVVARNVGGSKTRGLGEFVAGGFLVVAEEEVGAGEGGGVPGLGVEGGEGGKFVKAGWAGLHESD